MNDAIHALRKESDRLYPLVLENEATLAIENIEALPGDETFLTNYAAALTTVNDVLEAEKERTDGLIGALRSV